MTEVQPEADSSSGVAGLDGLDLAGVVSRSWRMLRAIRSELLAEEFHAAAEIDADRGVGEPEAPRDLGALELFDQAERQGLVIGPGE